MFSPDQWLASTGVSFYNNVATQSLRFDDGSNAFLTRTPSSAGNRRTFTWSSWVKRGNLGSDQVLLMAGADVNNQFRLVSEFSDAKFKVYYYVSGNKFVTPSAVFRDVSAWYHVVFAIDTTQSTASNRIKIYINGEQITDLETENQPTQNFETQINNDTLHAIGRRSYASDQYFDGYLSEVNLVDGLALDASYFGETKNGVWIAKEYTGSYGTNGFRLQFNQTGTGTASSSTIGADTSGNTNHWTSSGIVASDCAMPDSPENNWCTFNPLDKDSDLTLSEGNLKVVSTVSGYGVLKSTFAQNSGKWYWEIVLTTASVRSQIGIVKSTVNPTNTTVSASGTLFLYGTYYDGTPNANDGIIYYNGSSQGAYMSGGYTTNDIIGVALNLDDNEITFYKNGVSYGVAVSSIEDGDWIPAIADITTGYALSEVANFGQDSSFAGNKTAQGNTDGNGIGDFYYAPPSGFLALCSSNLPEPTISPNAGDGEQADDYFDTVTYAGTGATTHAITSLSFEPSWVWIKARDIAQDHTIYDQVRGVRAQLESNLTASEVVESAGNGLVSFDSNGFTLDGDTFTYGGINSSGYNYVAWNWKANGTGVSNTDGSITSTVSASTEAGFSIVTYTGNGSAGATVGHSLGTKPEMIILKERNASGNWVTYHEYANANAQNGYIALNLGSSWTSNSASWNNTSPTSSVFTLGNGTDVNTNNHTMLAYCFHSVEGYSKFGGYTGNSSSDGVFIYTGFRPAWFMVKVANGFTNNWTIYDNKTTTFNPDDTYLLANGNGTETTANAIDFLSNGIKLRNSSQAENNSSGTYIYMAFAENPFKYANAR